jgi:hypothetical protein
LLAVYRLKKDLSSFHRLFAKSSVFYKIFDIFLIFIF